jgi:hypothetical protein
VPTPVIPISGRRCRGELERTDLHVRRQGGRWPKARCAIEPCIRIAEGLLLVRRVERLLVRSMVPVGGIAETMMMLEGRERAASVGINGRVHIPIWGVASAAIDISDIIAVVLVGISAIIRRLLEVLQLLPRDRHIARLVRHRAWRGRSYLGCGSAILGRLDGVLLGLLYDSLRCFICLIISTCRGGDGVEHTLTSTPAETDPAASNGEALHPLDGTLSVSFADKLNESAVLANGYLDLHHESATCPQHKENATYIVDVTERSKEGAKRILRDERTEPSHEDSRIVRIGTRKLLAIGSNKIRENLARLRVFRSTPTAIIRHGSRGIRVRELREEGQVLCRVDGRVRFGCCLL